MLKEGRDEGGEKKVGKGYGRKTRKRNNLEGGSEEERN